MIDEPVPTIPERVPAIRPTMRTNRKPKFFSGTSSLRRASTLRRSY
jgi:hypothetical protein